MRQTFVAVLLALSCVRCTSESTTAGEEALSASSGTYRGTCDGSGAIAIDADHFIDANDEDQVLRVYRRGASATPVQSFDVNAALKIGDGAEADIEDFARIGDRLYGISSHGRSSAGALAPERHRFFAFDLGGTPPSLSLEPAGVTDTLLRQMVDARNWIAPDTKVLSAIQDAAALGEPVDESLAPENAGFNIEGLGSLGGSELVIGLRNPALDDAALLVTLTNPAAAVAGSPARFGRAYALDLGGLRIRGLAWSTTRQALLVLGGAKDPGTSFRLFEWRPDTAPVALRDITAPESSAPEAIVTYEGRSDVQIIFDQGDHPVGGKRCKKASPDKRSFTDVIVTLP